MSDEILDRLVKAIEKLSSNGDQLPKPEKLTIYDDYDLWEDRMKLYLESVSEGNRSLAILGQLDSEVYAVARAANITTSLTIATIFERLRREFGRSSMPWVARATLRDRRQHSGESVVDFQRHLRVLVKHAYPDDSCAALEDRIRDNFVDGNVFQGGIFGSFDGLMSAVKEYEKASSTSFSRTKSERLPATHPRVDAFKYRYVYFTCCQSGVFRSCSSKKKTADWGRIAREGTKFAPQPRIQSTDVLRLPQVAAVAGARREKPAAVDAADAPISRTAEGVPEK
nr:unnamed protein product [Spirometra erinaceieuropaei]